MRAASPHTEGTIDRNGIKLHYEIYGTGEHTILFVPTWMFVHSRCYKAQIPYFSEYMRCITWDPRGNGKSGTSINPSDYGQGHYVDDVIAVMDATNTRSAIVFGFSQSGPTCAILASYFPQRVQAAITIGTHTPLVPRFEHNSVERYNGQVKNPEGWEKYNRAYWKTNFEDFADFFSEQLFVEPHSTKQIADVRAWANGTNGEVLAASMDAPYAGKYKLDEAAYRRIKCPMLVVHGRKDPIAPVAASQKIAELTECELVIFDQAGHTPHARFPAKFNTLMRDFLGRHLSIWNSAYGAGSVPGKKVKAPKKILYLSSPIGLGHARRDLAISQELRTIHPDLQIHWLAQDPVTRFLNNNDEHIHPASRRLANESSHIESESGEHDLNAFEAIRNMDEILVKNFMVFQDVVGQGDYDLVVADEAWDVDHYWHEHPELKRAQVAWLTDFVGWVPMPGNGEQEALLTTDYNAEMIAHIDAHPGLRDRAIFVGNQNDIIPHRFGEGLPEMRDWVPAHFDFCGYVLGRHPSQFGSRDALRYKLGYREDEKVCIVTVGGSGVGGNLIRRILAAYPLAKQHIPAMRMIVVTGPRLNPAQFNLPVGVEIQSYVADLDMHLAACDLAVVQGGLTTCMELTAAGTPFIYFPLKNHFEQNFHVAHRLDQYGAGRRMHYDNSDPDTIAQQMVAELSRVTSFKPVESDGATRAAQMLSALL